MRNHTFAYSHMNLYIYISGVGTKNNTKIYYTSLLAKISYNKMEYLC